MKLPKFLPIILLALLSLTACQAGFNEQQFQGVTIGGTLNNQLTYFENRKVKSAIDGILNRHDKQAVASLLSVDADGEGSYEQGYILAQLVYKVGEMASVKCKTL